MSWAAKRGVAWEQGRVGGGSSPQRCRCRHRWSIWGRQSVLAGGGERFPPRTEGSHGTLLLHSWYTSVLWLLLWDPLIQALCAQLKVVSFLPKSSWNSRSPQFLPRDCQAWPYQSTTDAEMSTDERVGQKAIPAADRNNASLNWPVILYTTRRFSAMSCSVESQLADKTLLIHAISIAILSTEAFVMSTYLWGQGKWRLGL